MAWPARVNEVQSLRAASANQPSFPAYVKALTNWLPSNPISKAFFSIHVLALGARVSIPAATNACSSRIASARSISVLKVTALARLLRYQAHGQIFRIECQTLPATSGAENASVNVPRQNFRTIYIAATPDEFDDGISKFALDPVSLNRLVRLYVQNRGYASVFADLIGNPRSVH